jgi:hypothetical protein
MISDLYQSPLRYGATYEVCGHIWVETIPN